MNTEKFYILSFITMADTIRYFADGIGELEKGEQTTDINKAKKFNTKAEAQNKNNTLDAWYGLNTTHYLGNGIFTI
jgi:hypothetical protein